MRWINLDVVLAKDIPISETKRLQFRAEAFNVFNYMILAAPGTSIAPSSSNGAISYGSAGVISNIANTPRSLQLALKFMFYTEKKTIGFCRLLERAFGPRNFMKNWTRFSSGSRAG